jgi:CRP-like cAMP-binding protein
MATDKFAANGLLSRLSQGEHRRLFSNLQSVPLAFEQVLYEARGPIEYAYFPVSGVLSFIILMEDGSGIEVATIGNEGMLGLPAFVEAGTSPHRVLVQAAGNGFRIGAQLLLEEAAQSEHLRRLLVLYQSVFMTQISQSVACNGLHPVVKRCCRWLLMTHDRLESDELPLTHEFLAMMLGVRRASVTEVLQQLQQLGLISNGRAKVMIVNRQGLEAASCQCYQSVKDEFARLLG